jgi:hypothetical protein
MSYKYTTSSRGALRSTRDHFVEPPSLTSRLFSLLPTDLSLQVHRFWNTPFSDMDFTRHQGSPVLRALRYVAPRPCNWRPRTWANLPHALVAVWLFMLLWGERWVFQSALQQCRWEGWERWVRNTYATALRRLQLA